MTRSVLVIGYHEIACNIVDELIKHRVDKICIIPNRIRASQNSHWYRDIREHARKKCIEYFEVDSLSDLSVDTFVRRNQVDLIFSGFSEFVIPQNLIDYSCGEVFNFHNSSLPLYRGRAAPIWQIRAGESQSAMTLHKVVASVDSGDVIDSELVELSRIDTVVIAYLKFAFAQTKILRRSLRNILNKSYVSSPQSGIPSKYFWDDSVNRRIKLSEMTSKEVYDAVRSFSFPFPGVVTVVKDILFEIHELIVVVDKGDRCLDPGSWRIMSSGTVLVECLCGAVEIVVVGLSGRLMLAAQLFSDLDYDCVVE